MENLWLKENHHTAGLTSWGAYHLHKPTGQKSCVYKTIKFDMVGECQNPYKVYPAEQTKNS